MQALSGNTELNGVTNNSLSGSFRNIGMGAAGLGLLFAGIAVVKKLAKKEDRAMEALIGWFVAFAVYLGVWSLI